MNQMLIKQQSKSIEIEKNMHEKINTLSSKFLDIYLDKYNRFCDLTEVLDVLLHTVEKQFNVIKSKMDMTDKYNSNESIDRNYIINYLDKLNIIDSKLSKIEVSLGILFNKIKLFINDKQSLIESSNNNDINDINNNSEDNSQL